MDLVVLVTLVILGAGVVVYAIRGVAVDRARRRLFASCRAVIDDRTTAEKKGIERWLVAAGARGPHVVRRFVARMAVAAVVGLALALALHATGTVGSAVLWLTETPGNIGTLFVPLLRAMPVILFFFVALLPVALVTSARRRLVADVEEDLPLGLELLSTLAGAGMGFDAAISRILDKQPAHRPLFRELRVYQREALAGIPRSTALRRLAERLDVVTVSSFVSALVQAERTGMGIADVMRRQSDDLRVRLRENAMARAQALPVKLVFPLVICFLPGLFVLTIGPAFHSFFRLARNIVGE